MLLRFGLGFTRRADRTGETHAQGIDQRRAGSRKDIYSEIFRSRIDYEFSKGAGEHGGPPSIAVVSHCYVSREYGLF
jgi:hypothetical protein